VTRPRALAWLAAGAFAAGYTALADMRHRAFWSGRFDLGNLTQAVWSTAHGRWLEVTDTQGRQISRLGAHFDPIVATLAPLWRLWPNPMLLLTVQAVAVALGAVPVFLLARKHLDSEWAGLGCALAYLLYPATGWLVVDDFHPVALATPLLLAGIWLLDEDRLLPFAVVAGLACLTKEHVGFIVAALGLWYAATRRRPAGLAIAAAGAAISIVAIAVVVPHFAPGGGSPFEGRYADVGGSPQGILRTAVTHPGRIADAGLELRDLHYLFHLLVPLGFLPLLGPAVAATALPEIGLNVLSDVDTQTSIHFHYTAGAIPGLVAGAIFGAKRLRRLRQPIAGLALRSLVAIAVACSVVYGPVPLWRHVPFGATLGAYQYEHTSHADAAARALEAVPRGVALSASNTLGAHLSDRRRIFSFPVVRDARWVIVDTKRMSFGDDNLAHTKGLAALAELRRNRSWGLVFQQDGVLVLHLA
jgi:uncharacterized membrane protein